jgi:uncharacterized cupin superfamily protein
MNEEKAMSDKPSVQVAHLDDARQMTEFGDPRAGGDGVAARDSVWYLHSQSADDGASATVRCGVFHVVPGPSQLEMPYDELIVTLAGEGRTEVAGRPPVDVRPGGVLLIEAGADVTFNPVSLNREFFAVAERPARLAVGTDTFAAGEHERVEAHDRACCVLDGTATLVEPDGREHELRAGSFAFLPRGARTRWIVSEPLRAAFADVVGG